MKESAFCESFLNTDVVWRSIVHKRNMQWEPICLWKWFLSDSQNFTASARDYLFSKFAKFENNISFTMICTLTCAYQGVTNVNFPENFVNVLTEWPLQKNDCCKFHACVLCDPPPFSYFSFFFNFLISCLKTNFLAKNDPTNGIRKMGRGILVVFVS